MVGFFVVLFFFFFSSIPLSFKLRLNSCICGSICKISNASGSCSQQHL